ncbi:MAG: heme A synthase [Myxococcales bacterium]|nr:heme A synthase [Myxococcales bacterium]
MARFRRYSWLALAFVLAVILWGAFVRASGSGAGCGSHWPLCNGEVIPRAPALKTMIEFTHRVTSGLAAVAVLVQFIWSRRVFASGHPAGRWAAAGAALMVIEVLLGAGIVLLEYVAENKSVGRALWMGVHLVNTFLLVGAMTLTAHCATTRGPMRFAGRVVVSVLGLVGTLGILFTAATGGVAALGDTLFPPKTIGAALAEDFSPTAHVLVRMRHIHPFAAIGTALGLLLIRHVVASRVPTPGVAWRGVTLRVAVVSQVVVGFLNMMMLAPVWMQLVHLLLADAVWIAFVLFIATALAEPDPDRDATEFSTS